MDGIDIEPTFIYGENFENGIGVTLEISLSMHVEKKMPNNQISQVQIELNSYFEQEVALGFDVNVEDRWKWYLFIPVLEDLDVTVSVDIQDYTAMSVSAKVYTLRDETAKKKMEEDLRDSNRSGRVSGIEGKDPQDQSAGSEIEKIDHQE